MKKYLYGASVQGIQSFIFKTNKLKEIIGASELVEKICTTKFYEVTGLNSKSPNIIQCAAGNIKCILDEEQCRSLVLNFPKQIQSFAPGININQAVVLIDENEDPPLHELENRLKIQRNKISIPFEIGYMALEREKRTGGIAFEESIDIKGKIELLSQETKAKRGVVAFDLKSKDEHSKELLFKKISGLSNVSNRELSFDIKDITVSGKNSWIAIIHADGNGLGNILQIHGKELSRNKEFSNFSKKIELSTEKAVQHAFKEIIFKNRNSNSIEHTRYPIRPVVLGGDDLTVIIRADLAIDFTELFLKEFEKETEEHFKGLKTKGINKLTACAGIAFIKESYPLHYGIQLAEELCKDAKKSSRTESSLLFYKVQESFVEDLDTLKERTLKTNSDLSYFAGPYNFEKLKNLKTKLNVIKIESDKNDKSKAIGKLRQIVSETYKDKSTSLFMLERMKQVNSDFYEKLKLDIEKTEIEKNKGISQLVDLITLHSLNYGN